MTAKEYLKQLHTLDVKIGRLKLELDDIYNRAGGLKGIDYSADRNTGTPEADRMPAFLVQAERMRRRIEKLTGKYMALRGRIVQQILALDDPRYVQLLSYRYIDGYKLEQIADLMHKSDGEVYSYDHINRLHGWALESFSKKFLR